MFLRRDRRRMDRHAAARIVHGAAKKAGLGNKKISPHTLRHAVTAALDAGVPLRDVQVAPAFLSTGTPPTSSPPTSPAPPDNAPGDSPLTT